MKVKLGIRGLTLLRGILEWVDNGAEIFTQWAAGFPSPPPSCALGFDLQHKAEQRIPVGQVGKTEHFLNCPLICKHGLNLFSVYFSHE